MCPSLDKRSCGAVLNWLYADQQSTTRDQLHCSLSNPHVWRKLRRSAAPEWQKWQVIKQASWPRCFHGAAISRIGWEQVRALRNSAVRAGASAAVRLYYLTHEQCDPGCYHLWTTVRTFQRVSRDCGIVGEWWKMHMEKYHACMLKGKISRHAELPPC